MNFASAADLAVKAPPYKTQVDGWTGAYAGIIGGYATGPSHSEPTGILVIAGAYPIDLTTKGGFVGRQLGYNYQFANGAVLGIVGDMAWANLNGRAYVSMLTSAKRATHSIVRKFRGLSAVCRSPSMRISG